MEDGGVGWAELNEIYDAEFNESYDAFIQVRQQQASQQASRVPIINEDLHNDAFSLFSSN